MGEFERASAQPAAANAPRWQKILDLPDDTGLVRLDTGERLKAGWLKAVFHPSNPNMFWYFTLKGDPSIEIPEPMLRLVGDGRFSDSLSKKG